MMPNEYLSFVASLLLHLFTEAVKKKILCLQKHPMIFKALYPFTDTLKNIPPPEID